MFILLGLFLFELPGNNLYEIYEPSFCQDRRAYYEALCGTNIDFLKNVCKTINASINYTDIVQISKSQTQPVPNYILISFFSIMFSVNVYKNKTFKSDCLNYEGNSLLYKNSFETENVITSIHLWFLKNKRSMLKSYDSNKYSEDLSPEIYTVYLDFRKFSEILPKEKISVIESDITLGISRYIKNDITVKIINEETLKRCKTNMIYTHESIIDLDYFGRVYLPIENTKYGVRIYHERIIMKLLKTNDAFEEDKEVFEYFKNPDSVKFILSYLEKNSTAKCVILKKIFENYVSLKNINNTKQILHYETRKNEIFTTVFKYLLEGKIVFFSNTCHEFEGFRINQPYKMLYQFNSSVLSIFRENEDLYKKLIMRYCNNEIKFKSKSLEVLFVMDVYRIVILKLFKKINIRESNNAFERVINIIDSELNSINENIGNVILYNNRCVDLDLVLRILGK